MHYVTANVSLAVGANLHTLPDPSYFNQVPHSLLPPPINKQHAIERGNLWWSIYLIDCQLAVSLNVQGQIYLNPLDVRSCLLSIRLSTDFHTGEFYHHAFTYAVRYHAWGMIDAHICLIEL